MKRSLLCSAVLFACAAISSNGYAKAIIIDNKTNKVIEDAVIGSSDVKTGLAVKNKSTVVLANNEIKLSGKENALGAVMNSSVSIGKEDKPSSFLSANALANAFNIQNSSTLNIYADRVEASIANDGQAPLGGYMLFVNDHSTANIKANSIITNVTGLENTSALAAWDNSTIDIQLAEKFIVTSNQRALEVFNEGSELKLSASKILLNSSKEAVLASTGKINLSANEITIDSDWRAIWAQSNGKINIGSSEHPIEKISLYVSGMDGCAAGAMSNSTVNLAADEIFIESGYRGILSQEGAIVSVISTGKGTTITSKDEGISAFSGSMLTVAGNLSVTAPNAIEIRSTNNTDLTTVKINEDKSSTVQLTGNINFFHSGGVTNADVTVNLVGKNSFWTGTTMLGWENGTKPSEDSLNPEDMKLLIADGAQWTPTSTNNLDKNLQATALNNLKLDGGIINIKDETIEVNVENVKGTGTINLGTNLDAGLQAGSITFDQAEEGAALDVNFTSEDFKKEYTSDEITPDEAKELMKHIEGANIELTADVPEGFTEAGYGIDESGNAHFKPANTLMQSTLELASSAPLALNRIMINDVRKRLGDIRTTNGTHGAWARYDGGKLSGEAGLENDFRTIQVGIDTVPTPDSARMGVAFSYTDSDSEYARGSADMKAYSLAMYATKMFDNGMFVDVIGRMGTADTDLVVDGQHKGSMDNVALSLSGEMGWRFDLTDMVYVEPQAEVTYTYVNDDKVSVSTANYDIDAVNSLMGRVGFAAGLKCPDNFGNVYVRASAVHEFLGDSKIIGVNGDKSNTYEIDGQDTWVEYGIGANFNVTKSTYVWADVERTTGGALDEDWRATVGVRYAW